MKLIFVKLLRKMAYYYHVTVDIQNHYLCIVSTIYFSSMCNALDSSICFLDSLLMQ